MAPSVWHTLREDAGLALRGPASAEVLEQAQQALGHTLPLPLLDIYQQHDGQHPAGRPLFLDEYRWLSMQEALREWQVWQTTMAQPDMADMRHTHEACGASNATVRMDWWNERWWPLAVSALSDLLCIDGQPGPNGKPYQVIAVSSAHEARECVADSLTSLLGNAAADLEGDV
ncbi:SMI1/KNR4 family protein [Aquabacterium sp.]|uniref:SMI1/KNR4 family protein n=1 Tax=Aquabacterium sp. TaxID=1872578 RepID=UPI002486FE92|nr:SMI1/KNR4 family protein [Aquabacterium sp.]MDI1349003.1 SMI1/KNR4 family protein [Aquabacterium sp.]